jgi:hypothetical protein
METRSLLASPTASDSGVAAVVTPICRFDAAVRRLTATVCVAATTSRWPFAAAPEVVGR